MARTHEKPMANRTVMAFLKPMFCHRIVDAFRTKASSYFRDALRRDALAARTGSLVELVDHFVDLYS